jgi:hypothetical protein
MGADDVAVDLQTLERIQQRLAVLSTLKESLLNRNKELEDRLRQLGALRDREAYERDCLLAEITELRMQLERALK